MSLKNLNRLEVLEKVKLKKLARKRPLNNWVSAANKSIAYAENTVLKEPVVWFQNGMENPAIIV